MGNKKEEQDKRGNELLVGYSSKINDSAITAYVAKTKKMAMVFSIIIAVIVIVVFFIVGQNSDEMSTLESLIVSIGIAAMFIIIGLYSVLSRKKSNTWDGKVVDKKIKKKTERQGTDDNVYYSQYLMYQVKIKGNNGKKKILKWKNIDTAYNYYNIGDEVRYHGELKTFEKYNKSKDKIIFCNACLTKCNIEDDYCPHCKCPLLK